MLIIMLITLLNLSDRFNYWDHKIETLIDFPHTNVIWKIIAFIYDPKIIIVAVVLLATMALQDNDWKLATWLLMNIGLSDGIGYGLKKVVHRPRPEDHSQLDGGYSFPSGHILSSTTFTLLLLHLHDSFSIYSIVLIAGWVLLIVSRVTLSAHYPSDAIGAILVSFLSYNLSLYIIDIISIYL